MNIWSNIHFMHRFVYCQLAGKCRRQEILVHFDKTSSDVLCDGACCDVCISQTDSDMLDAKQEMKIITETVRNLPGFEEVKVCL